MINENRKPNRLIHEKSPYLLQHAYNPVDWYPWGDEAFAKAKAEDKPIFLSIGYSSCHWCHVMEMESFEDRDVADILNENFVSIKLDREERPDIDHFYMETCVAMTGHGGWPLSCFLTPDKKPFFCGTYFKKYDWGQIPGLISILNTISSLWKKDREQLILASEEIISYINKKRTSQANYSYDRFPELAFQHLQNRFDEVYGGFSPAPKFPSPHNLLFLMRYGLLYKNEKAFQMVDFTLECMARGGIFDHIGGGFSRYSTDRKWLVPHFEKMLYDNAMLLCAYSEAGTLIDKRHFETARRIADYCIREMRHKEGGFFTAEDADSEGIEGKFYVFEPKEVKKVLGEADGSKFNGLFDITESGNFEGKSIPNLIGKTLSSDEKLFALKCFEKLYKYRDNRIHPFKDDKILASSNGLMFAALSIAGRTLMSEKYIEAAQKAATFILKELIIHDRLYSSFRDGASKHPAVSDDYAYLSWGLLELYQATLKPSWLAACKKIVDNMLLLFWDEIDKNLYLSGNDVADIPMRGKNLIDGALPSGNSVAAQVLLRLSQLTLDISYAEKAKGIVASVAGEALNYPMGYTGMLSAQLLDMHGGTNITIVNGEGIDSMLEAAKEYNPFVTISICGEGYESMKAVIPNAEKYKAIDGNCAAHICSKGVCRTPVTDIIPIKEAVKSDYIM